MILELNGLTVTYGKKIAIRNLSLKLGAGAVGLLGPNGAGKSTLLKTVLGFLTPAAGSGRLLDMDITADPLAVRRQVGYMPESEGHIPGMNAVAFVAFTGELAGMGRLDAMARAHEVLSYVGLGEARYRSVDTYSTGMKQRIKLAQALIHDPKVLLLDEPTNGMDPAGRRSMLDLVRDISQRKKISILLCSHLLHDVEYACKEVVVLKEGAVVRSGNIEELKAHRRRVYTVRGKGDASTFRQVLQSMGCGVEEQRDKLLKVELPEGEDAQRIFEAASQNGFQVRHLTRQRMSLEDVFLDAIGAEGAGDNAIQVTDAADGNLVN